MTTPPDPQEAAPVEPGPQLRDFAAGRNTRSHVWYRYFNEIPVLVLFVTLGLILWISVARRFRSVGNITQGGYWLQIGGYFSHVRPSFGTVPRRR